MRRLILATGPIADVICKEVSISISEAQNDDQLTARLLWKFGFTPPRYEEVYERCRRRLDQFNDALLAKSVIATEGDREDLRSAGVNLFVSLEEVLEQTIAYNVWMLASDHFLDTRF